MHQFYFITHFVQYIRAFKFVFHKLKISSNTGPRMKKKQQQKTGKKLSYFYKLKFVISSCLEKRLLPKKFSFENFPYTKYIFNGQYIYH